MQEERFWLLVSLKLSGEATRQEITELDNLLQQHPEMGLRVDILRNIWQQKQGGLSGRKGDTLNKHLQRLSNHLSEPVLAYESDGPAGHFVNGGEQGMVSGQKDAAGIEAGQKNAEMTTADHKIALATTTDQKNAMSMDGSTKSESRIRGKRGWLWVAGGAAAAVAVFFVLSGQMMNHRKADRMNAQNTISTKRGSKSKIQLPDGTEVWLNADSRITYDDSFEGVYREVQLAGEAYFDVARDKDRPFIIHTSSIDIKVLGTALNVRSYCNEKNTEAALIRGSVEITLRNSPDKKIILLPNEKLVVQNGRASVLAGKPEERGGGVREPRTDNEPMMVLGKVHFQKKDSVAMEILWVKNKLAFDGESLKNVALKIERWYDVKMTITDENLKSTLYSGVFEDESLRQVMEALRMTGNFRYSINKKEVTIKP